MGVLVPIGFGIGGALVIVCMAYCLRDCKIINASGGPAYKRLEKPTFVSVR